MLGGLHIEFSRPQKSQQTQRIQSLFVAVLFQHLPQLMHLRILFLSGVARVAGLSFRSGGGKIVMIVYWVKLHPRIGRVLMIRRCCRHFVGEWGKRNGRATLPTELNRQARTVTDSVCEVEDINAVDAEIFCDRRCTLVA